MCLKPSHFNLMYVREGTVTKTWRYVREETVEGISNFAETAPRWPS